MIKHQYMKTIIKAHTPFMNKYRGKRH